MVHRGMNNIKVKAEVKPTVDNLVCRLHYRYTFVTYMGAALLCTFYDVIGEQIKCMTDLASDEYHDCDVPSAFNDVVNAYCFIMGTFTVDRLHGKKVGVEVPHPGVGPSKPTDAITYHAYYQWVPFVLFLQGLAFYLPHLVWKWWEHGLFRTVIQKLSIRDYLGDDLKTYFARDQQIKTLCQYVQRHREGRRGWALKFFLCELLNLGVVAATFVFTNWFLDGAFLTYGTDMFDMAGEDPENRMDPMSAVFPTVTKCEFRSFGSSGSIQVRDVMCLLATNIINEKIFLYLWVWLVLLMTVTSAWLLHRLLTILLPSFRRFLLKQQVKEHFESDVSSVMQYCSLSDWFLIHTLGRNMDETVFSEFIHEYAKTLARSTYNDVDEDKVNMNNVYVGFS